MGATISHILWDETTADPGFSEQYTASKDNASGLQSWSAPRIADSKKFEQLNGL